VVPAIKIVLLPIWLTSCDQLIYISAVLSSCVIVLRVTPMALINVLEGYLNLISLEYQINKCIEQSPCL